MKKICSLFALIIFATIPLQANRLFMLPRMLAKTCVPTFHYNGSYLGPLKIEDLTQPRRKPYDRLLIINGTLCKHLSSGASTTCNQPVITISVESSCHDDPESISIIPGSCNILVVNDPINNPNAYTWKPIEHVRLDDWVKIDNGVGLGYITNIKKETHPTATIYESTALWPSDTLNKNKPRYTMALGEIGVVISW